MKRKAMLEEIKDILFDYIKEIITWIGICSAIQQVLVNFMFDGVKLISKNITANDITSGLYFICFGGVVILTIKKVCDIFKSEFVIKVKGDTEQRIIIRLGGYAENMEHLLNKTNAEQKDCIFIIGINDEVTMDIAEKRGVHKSVLDKFYREQIEVEKLQGKVNESFHKKVGVPCEFGKVGLVDHSENSQIMFVVNSKFEGAQSTSILGPQPTDIIRNVFKTLDKQSVDIVQIPILSSRNVRCIENNNIRFSVTIAEIIDEYFKAILNTSNIDYDLVLSIRKEDLKENSISARDIVKFIKDLKPMYHIK